MFCVCVIAIHLYTTTSTNPFYDPQVFSDEEGADEGGSEVEEEIEGSPLTSQTFATAPPPPTATVNGSAHPPEPEPTPPAAPQTPTAPPQVPTPVPVRMPEASKYSYTICLYLHCLLYVLVFFLLI